MSLYRHKTLFQPQAIRAKKQTFSNLLSIFSPLLPLLAKRGDVLSLRAAERAGGEVCAAVNQKGQAS
jgi:hypothetical protein